MNPRPAGPPTLRRHNLGLVLAALRAAGGASRAELAARTGLTRATVATLLEPVTAVLIAVLFLGETLTTAGVLGCLLILGAIGTLGRRQPHPQPQ